MTILELRVEKKTLNRPGLSDGLRGLGFDYSLTGATNAFGVIVSTMQMHDAC